MSGIKMSFGISSARLRKPVGTNTYNTFNMIDFLCIGAQKAGTTWLMANLNHHPKVWTPKFAKELHYFDSVYLDTNKTYVLEGYERFINRIQNINTKSEKYYAKVADPDFAFTDKWYKHVFSIAPKFSVRGECTPFYTSLPLDGIKHIKRLAPKVRLIHMIRDPFERMLSSYLMYMDRRFTNDGDRLRHLLNHELFVSRGDYRGNIARWENIFDPDQILHVPFGLIKTDPGKLMKDVEKHLKISSFDNYPKLGKTVHPTNKEGKTISSAIMDGIKQITDPQRAYLSERFGEEFLSLTK